MGCTLRAYHTPYQVIARSTMTDVTSGGPNVTNSLVAATSARRLILSRGVEGKYLVDMGAEP